MTDDDAARGTRTGEVARIVSTLKAVQPVPPPPPPPADAPVDTPAHAPVPDPPAAAAGPADGPADGPAADIPSAPRREPAGVRRQLDLALPDPAHRWNPGARYRTSRLAGLRDAERAVAAARASRPQADAVTSVEPGCAPATGAVPVLAGRLYRGPARRVRVFDRDIWRAARSVRAPRDISEALTVAVERYRTGAINTTGLVRAIGHALAA